MKSAYKACVFTLIFTLCLRPAVAERTVLRSATEVNNFLSRGEGQVAMTVTGVVQRTHDAATNRAYVTLHDGTAPTLLLLDKSAGTAKPGDRVIASGHATIGNEGEPLAFADNLSKIGVGAVLPPRPVRLPDLDENLHHLYTVVTEGTVVDIFDDDVDPDNRFLLLKDAETVIPVSCRRDRPLAEERQRLLEARLRLTGTFKRSVLGVRKFSGPFIDLGDNKPTILRAAPTDPFDAPTLEKRIYLTPKEVSRLGKRSVRGRVVASWREGRLLIKDRTMRITEAELADGTPLPPCGTEGIVVGYPDTNLFRINLTMATFRAEPVGGIPEDIPEEVSPSGMAAAGWHQSGTVSGSFHGKLIRLHGTVRTVPQESSGTSRLLLDCEGHLVPIETSTLATSGERVQIGSEIEVTGRCLLLTDDRSAHRLFPRINGLAVVLRNAEDIRVIRTPPWLTPRRLLIACGLLLATVLVVIVWNVILHKLVERRSKALYHEQLIRERTELRIEDRTQLAVELHDSVSQNLSGASMQIDTVSALIDTDRAKALTHLGIAAKTLASCRQELRNCIWDLRNSALDDADLNSAIRKSLEPYTGDAVLRIDIELRRSRLSDNVTHTLLRIVRELAVNAARHGKAKSIEIVGTHEDNRIHMSVTDDGCGFDPENRPGIAEGHFGLQGVEERIEQLGGEMSVQSKPGNGARIEIWIKSEC